MNTLFVAARTRNVGAAGSKGYTYQTGGDPKFTSSGEVSVPVLNYLGVTWFVLNQHGLDTVSGLPDSWSFDAPRGQSIVWQYDGQHVDDDSLGSDQAYLRLSVLSDDLWQPDLVFAWGMMDDGQLLPLGLEMSDIRLSTDPREGVPTLPIRRVGGGDENTVYHRLLLIITTASDWWAGTDDSVQLQLFGNGQLLVSHFLPDTPQKDLQKGKSNIYELPVLHPFTSSDLNSSTLRISIAGENAYKASAFYLFALSTQAGRSDVVMPLWSTPPPVLSTNAEEGVSFSEVTLGH